MDSTTSSSNSPWTPVMVEKAKHWQRAFAQHDHYIEPLMALRIAAWWEDPESALLLEGEPGGGKTSIAEILPKIVGAAFYQLQCFKSVGVQQIIGVWDEKIQGFLNQTAFNTNNGVIPDDLNKIVYDHRALRKGAFIQALEDSHEHVIFNIDEVDKLPKEDHAEAMLLQGLGSQKITVAESQTEIKRRPGLKPVRSILTSNLGKNGWMETARRESLSLPLLSRNWYIYVPPPSAVNQYSILRRAAPGLPQNVILEAVQFLQRVRTRVQLDKAISLREAKRWVRSLQTFEVKSLTEPIIRATATALVQISIDEQRLLSLTSSILAHNVRHRDGFIKIMKQQLEAIKQEQSQADFKLMVA